MRTQFVMFAIAAVSSAALTLSACDGNSSEKKNDSERKSAASISVRVADSEYGRILVDQSGRTLYAFGKDKAGASECDVSCIAVWPALTTSSAAKAGVGAQKVLLAERQRATGVSQVMYNEWPLYYYAGDAVAGDTNGQGVDGEWFVVSADGKLLEMQAS
ncbi:COG4315 family predicted lipoprotein [Streptomyces hyaluromycini]|uniref:COG4315 family predicted lipoprotein n=1 Tax=Streptomyces hyaluromycini TaxID=1377993 RepID=UPI00142DD210|nr:hypothetical protein [Streptomyces hyaluromycini]